MRPVLLSWHGLNLYSYPLFLYLGLVAGVFAGAWAAPEVGLPPDRVVTATLILLVPALVGARLAYVLGRIDLYRREPRRILQRWQGGAVMYGGFLLAVPVSIPLLHLLGLPFLAYWDTATLTILAGMILTRLGCLLNGCCAGRPTAGRIGLSLPDSTGVWCRRVPTQLFEACSAALIFVGAVVLAPREPFPGAVFLAALIVYASTRIALDLTRAGPRRSGRLTVAQLVSAALAVAALAALLPRMAGV
jgi:phosphatidylglycerol---prolipoprotein diacylglyceryl transferase